MDKSRAPKWEHLLLGVIDCARGTGLTDTNHPDDWRRFYLFINHCHTHRVHLGWVDLRNRLEDRGVLPAEADKLARIYWHGRMILMFKGGCWARPPGYLDDRP